MKKTISFAVCPFLIALIVFSFFNIFTLRTNAEILQTSNEIQWTKEDCTMLSSVADMPNTFEATVQLDPDTDKGGVLLGNFIKENSGKSSIDFGISDTGNPYLKYIDPDGYVADCRFNLTDIRNSEFQRIAITRNAETNIISCYVNGELKQSVEMHIADFVPITPYAIGNDRRDIKDISARFHGSIKNLAIYSDCKTPDEIKKSFSTDTFSSSNLIAAYDFEGKSIYFDETVSEKIITDLSGNGNHLRHSYLWKKNVKDPEQYAYSFAVVGDTQGIMRYAPEQVPKLYDYIVDNIKTKNIKHVFGLGDITDANSEEEWLLAKTNIDKLNGLVSYSLVRGNHDLLSQGINGFEQYFGIDSAYAKQCTSYFYDTSNSAHEFSTDRLDYLVVSLDYAPDDDMLEWANHIIEEHPNHNVIVTTHGYLNSDGTLIADGKVDTNRLPSRDGGYNSGEYIFQNLISKHENIVLVLCGHSTGQQIAVRQSKGDNGNAIVELEIDPTAISDYREETAAVVFLYFSEDGKTMTTQYYCTSREEYYRTVNEMTFTLNTVGDKGEPEQENGNTNPPQSPTDTGCNGCNSTVNSQLPIIAVSLCIAAYVFFKKKLS